jgi:uncharacterized spore protein YtfJ
MIIPVAQIAYGYGGGYGRGKDAMKQKESSGVDQNNIGEGAGGGGGMVARAKGVYEITPAHTRFIPASGAKILLTGLVIGFVMRGFFFHKQRK